MSWPLFAAATTPPARLAADTTPPVTALPVDYDKLTELAAAISTLVNVLAVIAALLGWKHYRRLSDVASVTRRVADAVILGVERFSQEVEQPKAKKLKQTIKGDALLAGAEGDLHRRLVELGLSEPSEDDEEE